MCYVPPLNPTPSTHHHCTTRQPPPTNTPTMCRLAPCSLAATAAALLLLARPADAGQLLRGDPAGTSPCMSACMYTASHEPRIPAQTQPNPNPTQPTLPYRTHRRRHHRPHAGPGAVGLPPARPCGAGGGAGGARAGEVSAWRWGRRRRGRGGGGVCVRGLRWRVGGGGVGGTGFGEMLNMDE